MKRSDLLASSHPSQRGVALVITLFFLVIITVVIIGFVDSTRVERAAASSHLERVRAGAIASQGIETVIATLRRETADPIRNWTSQPGSLVVPGPPPADQKRLRTIVPLHTGAPSPVFLAEAGLDPVLRSANLNVRVLSDQQPPTYVLDDARDPATSKAREMKLRWIYVRKNTEANGTNIDLGTDGLPAEQPDTRNQSNPIVGRYAYWADDESTKVNYNLAWTREPKLNTNPPGHQTRIDLRALPLFDADSTKPLAEQLSNKLHSFVTKDNYKTVNRFFNTPFDARLFGDLQLREALDLNKFNLTHYNSDPDTTYYGKARMVLTTQLSNAVLRDANGKVMLDKAKKPITRPFLDILIRNPVTNLDYIDPGFLSRIDGNKLSKVINELVADYLKRSDWPMVDGKGASLQSKYYADYSGLAREQRLAQLALNLVDYVRSAESKKLVVEPIRAQYSGSQFVGDFIDTSLRGKEDTYKGLTRGLHITEMGMWVADKAETSGSNAGRYRTFAFVEVFLPPNYGIGEIDLLGTPEVDEKGSTVTKRWQAYFFDFTGGGRSSKYYYRDGSALTDDPTHSAFRQIEHRDTLNPPAGTSKNSVAFVWEAVGNRAKSKMLAGEYRTIAIEAWRAESRTAKPKLNLRGAVTIERGTAARIDVAPVGDPGQSVKPVAYTLNPQPIDIGAILQNISSFETADPRVNGVANDWRSAAVNTFGRENEAWRATVHKPTIITKTTEPEQDLDADALVTAASLRMPFPFDPGKQLNPSGRVRSSGELGLIHTGIEGSSLAPRGGIPWRTLRLQPSKLPTTIVPDWAFMDLFTVPADVPQSAAVLFAPRGTSTGGRVNMNAKPAPFQLDRLDPLKAVLNNCRKNSSGQMLTVEEAKETAGKIYGRKRAAKSKLPEGKPYPQLAAGVPDVFESPGEVVEIEGVADQGEESEELVREIANLITARGNVFSVYTVGQAIKQTPSGALLVNGEERQHAFVERYLVDKGNSDPADDVIGFRTIYFRNLTP